MSPERSPAVSQAARLTRNSNAIYLATHVRPDGDALGSLLGLALALEAAGHRVARLCADPVPEYYCWLPGAAAVSAVPPGWEADLGIVVDCDGLPRVGDLESSFRSLPHLIDIDHHSGPHAFGEVQCVDPEAAAAAEIVFSLLRKIGSEIAAPVATCLYTGLLDDTGRFAYANTTPRALRAAAELIELGADPVRVGKKLFFERSFGSVRLLGKALSGSRLHAEGRIVSSLLRVSDFAEAGAVPADTEGIIDRLRTVVGPAVAALFVEQADGRVRVSLRSDGEPAMNRVCARFGGGGHPGAAGCTVGGDPERVREEVLAAVERALSPVGGGDAA